jgi:hypothetical protein
LLWPEAAGLLAGPADLLVIDVCAHRHCTDWLFFVESRALETPPLWNDSKGIGLHPDG